MSWSRRGLIFPVSAIVLEGRLYEGNLNGRGDTAQIEWVVPRIIHELCCNRRGLHHITQYLSWRKWLSHARAVAPKYRHFIFTLDLWWKRHGVFGYTTDRISTSPLTENHCDLNHRGDLGIFSDVISSEMISIIMKSLHTINARTMLWSRTNWRQRERVCPFRKYFKSYINY